MSRSKNLRGYAGCRPRNITSLGMGLDLSLGNGRGGSSGAATISAPFSFVNGPADGPVATWYEGITCTYGATHTVSSIEPFTVRRKGYTTAGAATTYDDTVYVTRMARPGYPEGSVQPIANTLTTGAFSEPVYQQDVLFGGATNNSTMAYPPPVGGWIDVPKQLITGSTFRLESYHTHLFARNGQGVACVKHTGNPTTGSTVTKTATYGKSVKYGDAVPCYYTDWSTADFPSNGTARVRYGWECFPWIGDSSTSSTGTYTADITKTNEDITHYTTGPATIWYAYVDGVGAGTPTAQTSHAAAKATPYANEIAAANALIAKSADVSFYVLTFSAGFAHTWSNTNWTGGTRTAKDGYLIVRGDPDDADPYTNVTVTASGTNKVMFTSPGAGEKNYVCFRDMTFTIAAASNWGNFGGNTSLWRDHVKIVVNVATNSQMGSMSYGFCTRCDAPTATGSAFSTSSTNLNIHLLRASTTTTVINPNILVSTKADGASGAFGLGGSNMAKENLWALDMQCLNTTTTANIALAFPTAAAGPPIQQRNIAFVNFIISNSTAGSPGPSFPFTEHGNIYLQNFILFNGTGGNCGASSNLDACRLNILADPPGPFPANQTAAGTSFGTATDQPSWRNIGLRNLSFSRMSWKFDTFSGSNESPHNLGSVNVLGGTWGVLGVCFRNLNSEYAVDTNFRTDVATSENGYGGINTHCAAPVVYTDRANNNWKPVSGYTQVPAVDLVDAYDVFGTAFRTDGTEASGAVAR